MDPMTISLCGAIAALWAYIVYSNRRNDQRGERCEARNDALSNEIKATKDKFIDEMTERESVARNQAVVIARALEQQTEIAGESLAVMREMKELTYRTVRALRRYAGERTPGDGTKEDDSDTSRFFQDQIDPLEPKQK